MRRIYAVAGALFLLLVLSVPVFAQTGGRLSWSGDVDETILVRLHHDNVSTETVSGKDPINVRVHIDGRLSHQVASVTLGNWSGRGQVTLVRQPTQDNNFTAVVRITDPDSGRGHYHFVLTW